MTPDETDKDAPEWPDRETFRALAFLIAYGLCRVWLSKADHCPATCELACQMACRQAASESAAMTEAFYRRPPLAGPGDGP
jgi:hypothetical protein